jgi:hypothetical protein
MDHAGIDECCVAEVEDQIAPTFENTVDVLAEIWRVDEIEVSLETQSDDLVGLLDHANDSFTVLGADGRSEHLVPPCSLADNSASPDVRFRLGIQAGPVPVREERSSVGVHFLAAGRKVLNHLPETVYTFPARVPKRGGGACPSLNIVCRC